MTSPEERAVEVLVAQLELPLHWHPDDETAHPDWTGNHFLARDLVHALSSAGLHITDLTGSRATALVALLDTAEVEIEAALSPNAQDLTAVLTELRRLSSQDGVE